jgi:DHA3 family macrolide efflux protein-like MFS transporter
MIKKQDNKSPSGMFGFTIVWTGQLVSVLGTSMTQFAMTIWAYRETGSALALGAVTTAFIVPFLLLSPIAGAMVDRYNRKVMMMVSDLIAVFATSSLLIIYATGHLQIWHLYVIATINGIGSTFQWPAYSAAISTMVPKENYSRANGMMSLITSGPAVLAPMLAGLLLPVIQITGVLIVDVATFLVAIGALSIVDVPRPAKTVSGQAEHSSNLFKEGMYGFKYIFQRPSLLGLLIFFISLNFVIGLSINLLAPFILIRTHYNNTALGAVQSAGAIGAVVGGILVSLWPGFKRRTNNIFFGETLTGLFALTLFGLGRNLPFWIIFAALGNITPIYVNGSSQAIWQAKVAPDVQGRVFSARRMIAWITYPITPILAGALADYVTEPAMQSGSLLAKTFGWLVGTEPGSGMALQFFLAGICYILLALGTYLFFPVIRNMENLLPDHDHMETVPPI